jgi:hypothetical protein
MNWRTEKVVGKLDPKSASPNCGRKGDRPDFGFPLVDYLSPHLAHSQPALDRSPLAVVDDGHPSHLLLPDTKELVMVVWHNSLNWNWAAFFKADGLFKGGSWGKAESKRKGSKKRGD